MKRTNEGSVEGKTQIAVARSSAHVKTYRRGWRVKRKTQLQREENEENIRDEIEKKNAIGVLLLERGKRRFWSRVLEYQRVLNLSVLCEKYRKREMSN